MGNFGTMAVRFTIEFCKNQLDKYTEAEAAVLRSQSYSIGGRALTRANLSDIRAGIEYWAAKLSDAEAATKSGRYGIRTIRVIPHG